MPAFWAFRMRVSISPKGSLNGICPILLTSLP
jgi:hypothetical protein